MWEARGTQGVVKETKLSCLCTKTADGLHCRLLLAWRGTSTWAVSHSFLDARRIGCAEPKKSDAFFLLPLAQHLRPCVVLVAKCWFVSQKKVNVDAPFRTIITSTTTLTSFAIKLGPPKWPQFKKFSTRSLRCPQHPSLTSTLTLATERFPNTSRSFWANMLASPIPSDA